MNFMEIERSKNQDVLKCLFFLLPFRQDVDDAVYVTIFRGHTHIYTHIGEGEGEVNYTPTSSHQQPVKYTPQYTDGKIVKISGECEFKLCIGITETS